MVENNKKYVWATYRDWSFKILESIQSLDGWETGLIITTSDCQYDLSKFEDLEIPVLRVDNPKTCFKETGEALEHLLKIKPETILFPGWSWYVPKQVLDLATSVVLHPGKLPKDRGGSPIQNQMRRGKEWTYLNMIEMVEDIDAGPIYVKEKMSLEGTAEDVWPRMTATGSFLTRNYLTRLAKGNFEPTPQPEGEPVVYKRVKPEDSELRLDGSMNAEQMHNIIRAHYELDQNTYVKPAFLTFGNRRLIVEGSSLEKPEIVSGEVVKDSAELKSLDFFVLSSDVMNGKKYLALEDNLGKQVYLTRFNIGIN